MKRDFIVHVYSHDVWGVGNTEAEAREASGLLAKECAAQDGESDPQQAYEEMQHDGECITVTLEAREDNFNAMAKILLANAQWHPKTGVE